MFTVISGSTISNNSQSNINQLMVTTYGINLRK